VQTNSATAEEGDAASEELSGQAQVLQDLVNTVRLKDSADTMYPDTVYEVEEFSVKAYE
jgi:methyl-accepting chemotaxis protein